MQKSACLIEQHGLQKETNGAARALVPNAKDWPVI